MTDIVCPECGHESSFVAIRRSADEFCPQCDFPLFWAPSAVPMATPGSTNMATLRRLPGAGGRQRVGSKVCPECGELSPLTETHCIRCGADLDPKPEPAPEPEPIREVVVPPPPPPPEPTRPWWVIPGIVIAGIANIVLLIEVYDWWW
ncbi:MAG: zinc ribbon domain-containing protein [Ilumatobacter fluminis]|uniref:double zinc ribbon domain-containing protein n=1 Tax=Ilumatobacter fluminis TaxID=467091 RepID=UPI0032EADC06